MTLMKLNSDAKDKMGFQIFWDPRTKEYVTEEELLERWKKEHEQIIEDNVHDEDVMYKK